MPKASAPKVRRFDAILLDLGHEDRRSFCRKFGLDATGLSRLLVHNFAPDSLRERVAKALKMERADLDAVVANEVRIAAERRARKAVQP